MAILRYTKSKLISVLDTLHFNTRDINQLNVSL